MPPHTTTKSPPRVRKPLGQLLDASLEGSFGGGGPSYSFGGAGPRVSTPSLEAKREAASNERKSSSKKKFKSPPAHKRTSTSPSLSTSPVVSHPASPFPLPLPGSRPGSRRGTHRDREGLVAVEPHADRNSPPAAGRAAGRATAGGDAHASSNERPPPIAIGTVGAGALNKRGNRWSGVGGTGGTKEPSMTLKDSLRRGLQQAREEQQRHDYEVIRARSSRAFRLHDWKAADESLSLQIEELGGQRNPQLFASRSFANLKLHRPTDALRDADAAVTLDPTSSVGHARRAASLIRLDRAAEAGTALLESMDRTRANGPAVDRWGTDRWGGAHSSLVPRHGNSTPCADGAVDLFGSVLGRIRRQRSFPCLRERESLAPIGRKPETLRNPTGRGLGPPRLQVDSDEFDGAERYPAPCGPLELVETRKHRLSVRWHEADLDGDDNDDDDWYRLLGYDLEIAEAPTQAPGGTATTTATASNSNSSSSSSSSSSSTAVLVWRRVYAGFETSFEVRGLSQDTDYLLRVSSRNRVGNGPYATLSATTLLDDHAALAKPAQLPPSWLALEAHMEDMLEEGYTGVPKRAHWEGVKESLMRYHVQLKGAFRLYTLLGPTERAPPGDGEAMSLPQFHRFVEECGITKANATGVPASSSTSAAAPSAAVRAATTAADAASPAEDPAADTSSGGGGGARGGLGGNRLPPGWGSDASSSSRANGNTGMALSRHEVELCFTRANRELTESLGAASVHGLPSNDDNPDGALLHHEFVHALLRLGKARYGGLIAPGSDPSPLASVLERLMEHCVLPRASFELRDALSDALRQRAVRNVWKRHERTLRDLYEGYSRIGTELTGGDEGEEGEANEANMLNLKELLILFREANLLDGGRCSARAVTGFFVQVNIDDELIDSGDARVATDDAGGAGDGGGDDDEDARETVDAAQLDFEEFLEVIARLCNEKVPEPRAEPFDETLSSWLALFFLPAVRTVCKARQIRLGVS
jgi:hypothetical protein